MKPHDCKGLNDMQYWHADLLRDQIGLWRWRNLGDTVCFKVARIDAQKRFPLEPEEAMRMDSYVAARFGSPKAENWPEGTPVPAFTVRRRGELTN